MATYTITFSIPDAKATDYLDTLATRLGYQDTIDGSPNPQIKKSFIKDKIYLYLENEYKAQKATEADAARTTALSDADDFLSDITAQDS